MNSVYLLTFPNGKYYVGQTSKSVKERFTSHCWDRTKSNSQLHRPITFAMKKYKGQVICSILEENLSIDEADFLEKYYIKFYNSLAIENGYNVSAGGNSGSIMSESGKLRHKEKMKKHYANSDYVNKITAHLKTEDHRNKMKLGFEEFLKKNPNHYTKINTGRKRTHESSLKHAKSMGGKPFMCVETGEIFYLLKDAANRFGTLHKNSIYKVLKGKRKTFKKLHFKYVE